VRDLMTGRTPKDFDIGTDARPQEVRRLFRNSRVIGRRFRLVHVLFDAGKVVEVSTFRRTPDAVQGEQGQEGDDDLLIRSDNTFGTPQEDAVRRDFTINGLFYDIATYAVLDYVGGVEDLEARVVRTIGDPLIRFREDPVRMLRACEVAARLAFSMESGTRSALDELRHEVTRSAAPRVTEELLDPLRRGWGHDTYRLWSETGLLGVLLPEVDGEAGVNAPDGPAKKFFGAMLREADARTAAGARPEDATLLGMLFLPVVLAAVRRRGRPGAGVGPAQILLVLEDAVNPLALRMSLPNHTTHTLKQALYTMGRLTATEPAQSAARRIVGRPYFAPAVTLLSLYAKATNRYREAAAAWEEVAARGTGTSAMQGTPFPDALVPPPEPAPLGTLARRRRRRRRGPRQVAGTA
jgi:poly(A) polymerase